MVKYHKHNTEQLNQITKEYIQYAFNYISFKTGKGTYIIRDQDSEYPFLGINDWKKAIGGFWVYNFLFPRSL